MPTLNTWRALLDLTKQNNLPAYLHLFTDGKDAYKKRGDFYAELEKDLAENYPDIKIASVSAESTLWTETAIGKK